nr:hypothetical protein [Ignavibacteria bacterium]
MSNKAPKYTFLGIFAVVIIAGIVFTQADYGQEAKQSTKITEPVVEKNEKAPSGYEKVTLPLTDVENIDGQIEDYLLDMWPIMSDEEVQAIVGSKDIAKKLVNDTLGHVEFSLTINVPSHYLVPNPKMLWEL